MSKCGICNQGEAVHECELCLGNFCDKHFDVDEGVCVECGRDEGCGCERCNPELYD